MNVEKASHPSDVYWKNIKYSAFSRTKRTIFSFVVLIMFLVFAFVLLLIVESFKLAYQKGSEKKDMNTQIKVYSLVFVIVIITMLLNKGLTLIIYYLTRGERQTTRSNEIFSVITKMVLAHFVNTAILYYGVSRVLDDSFTSKVGLVLQITSLIIISGVINILYSLINPWALLKRFILFWKYRKMENEDSVDQFQR